MLAFTRFLNDDLCTNFSAIISLTLCSLNLQDVEILVLDEADRLLEVGFADEVREIVKMCPRGRQSMLFSATLSDKVCQFCHVLCDLLGAEQLCCPLLGCGCAACLFA